MTCWMFQLLRIRVWEEVWHRHLFQDSTDNFILHIASNSYIGARKMFNRKTIFSEPSSHLFWPTTDMLHGAALGPPLSLAMRPLKSNEWNIYIQTFKLLTCANFLTNFSWISWWSSSSAFAPEGSPITIFAWQYFYSILILYKN